MEAIPAEILMHIFGELPMSEIGSVRCVCRLWKHAIEDVCDIVIERKVARYQRIFPNFTDTRSLTLRICGEMGLIHRMPPPARMNANMLESAILGFAVSRCSKAIASLQRELRTRRDRDMTRIRLGARGATPLFLAHVRTKPRSQVELRLYATGGSWHRKRARLNEPIP
jgi:hypothetical protein